MDIQSIKRANSIIGNDPQLDRAIEIAVQVAPTDLTVLITGESGTGKESFPKIIHQNSSRKHNAYFAINCGAIPEGTIDSELFGHEKGSFTGAVADRKGYFESADGGTLFLDEVAELPLSTQVRLLRVLENNEYIKVGGSKVMKSNVRVVAATNADLVDLIEKGKFREDLYYRLNTVPIRIPALRERKDDIKLLFRKFASDFAEKYKMPPVTLTMEAQKIITEYRWNGNIRQLKNFVEQLSIIESQRVVTEDVLKKYLQDDVATLLPVHVKKDESQDMLSDRDILYKVLFDMKNDILELRKTVAELSEKSNNAKAAFISNPPMAHIGDTIITHVDHDTAEDVEQEDFEVLSNDEAVRSHNDTLSLEKVEIDMIRKALDKYKGKRKDAAKELGISERTLYRKINEYNIS